jgi:polyhydroxyalkanoate synthesis regulator phasin
MPQPKKSGSSAREPPGGAEGREAHSREDQLLTAIASLRDVLSKGIVITSDRLQEIVDEAVKRGRMTGQDAEELVQNLVAVGRRQSQDALADIEDLVGRSAQQTRSQARAQAKSVGAAARQVLTAIERKLR